MELKEFITNTIKEVADGILEGHGYVKEKKIGGVKQQKIKINFDVNVASDETNILGAGGKLVIASLISFGAKAENKTANSQYNKIQFSLEVDMETGKY